MQYKFSFDNLDNDRLEKSQKAKQNKAKYKNQTTDLTYIDPDTILSLIEIDRCTEIFYAIDKNGSKMIEKEELKKALEVLGQTVTEEEVIQMIS